MSTFERRAVGHETVVGADRNRRGQAVDERYARVRQVVLLLVQVGEGERVRPADAEGDRRSESPAPVLDEVALRDRGGLTHGVHTEGVVGPERLVHVRGAAVEGVRAEVRGEHIERSEEGCLAHLVDGAARRAAPEQHGRGTIDDLRRLQIEAVARVDGGVPDAIEEEVVERREAANVDRVPPRGALSCVEGDAGNVLQSLLEPSVGLLLDELAAHDGDRLRNVLHVLGQLVLDEGPKAGHGDLLQVGVRIRGGGLIGCAVGMRRRRAEERGYPHPADAQGAEALPGETRCLRAGALPDLSRCL